MNRCRVPRTAPNMRWLRLRTEGSACEGRGTGGGDREPCGDLWNYEAGTIRGGIRACLHRHLVCRARGLLGLVPAASVLRRGATLREKSAAGARSEPTTLNRPARERRQACIDAHPRASATTTALWSFERFAGGSCEAAPSTEGNLL